MPEPRRPVLSLPQARRIALAAQGVAGPRPCGPVTMRRVQGQIDRLGQFQIDSVNVLARAHLMPLFTRLGPYDTGLLKRAAEQEPRRLFEYWGHAASLVDIRLEPALRWRMAAHAKGHPWGFETNPDLAIQCLEQVRASGPLTPRQLDDGRPRTKDHWGWNWSATKQAMEWLHSSGQLAVAGRNEQFERLFDLPERVLPAVISQTPAPDIDQAHVALVTRAARALGVATEVCLADYFRLSRARTRTAIEELVAQDLLEPVAVAGWTERAYLWSGARLPRRVEAARLVSPFDPLIFERRRALGLFGLDYKIEIYVPAPLRRFGYYVLPFLMGEGFAARVDLKADRRHGSLLVQSAWAETGAPDRQQTAEALATELVLMADWLGLESVIVASQGDLAPALTASVRRLHS